MCVIIDADVVRLALVPPVNADFVPLERSLRGGKARIVYGGKLTEEYLKVRKLIPILTQLDRAGRTRVISDDKVDAATEQVQQTGLCRSNDHHVIGLARVSGVRLLCTNDNDLTADFKNHRLLNRPRGKVYRRRGDLAKLISQHCRRLPTS